MVTPYSTNFHKEDTGNALYKGEDLTVTVFDRQTKKAPIYAAGVLYSLANGKRAIQIEQTGHRGNPSKTSITFEMVSPNGQPMDKGDYEIEIRANFGSGDLGWNDVFQIV